MPAICKSDLCSWFEVHDLLPFTAKRSQFAEQCRCERGRATGPELRLCVEKKQR